MPFPVRIVVLLLTSSILPALDVAVAPFRVLAVDPAVSITDRERSFGRTLDELIRRFDTDRVIRFQTFPDGATPAAVRTAAEARRAAELYGHDYVAYGTICVGSALLEAEICLYSREAKAVHKRLFAKASREDLIEAASDLARRFVEYVYLQFEPEGRAVHYRRHFTGLILSTGAGSWTALGEWRRAVSGVLTGVLGLRVVPAAPLRRGPDWLSYLRFGADIRYSMGLNAPTAVTSRLHSFDFQLAAELSVEPDGHSILSLGIGPMLRILYAFQQTHYTSTSATVSGTVGFSASAAYEYWFGADHRFAIGTRAVLGAEQAAPIFLHLSLELYGSIHLPGGTDAGTTI